MLSAMGPQAVRVGIQLEKAAVGPTYGPTRRLSHRDEHDGEGKLSHVQGKLSQSGGKLSP